MYLIISIVIALIIGFIFRKALIDSMSNVRIAQEAQEYLKRDSVDITTIIDTYLYTNITVIPKDNDDKNLDDDNDANNNDDDSGDDSSNSDSGGSDSD